jgi:hypothetical protein
LKTKTTKGLEPVFQRAGLDGGGGGYVRLIVLAAMLIAVADGSHDGHGHGFSFCVRDRTGWPRRRFGDPGMKPGE